MARGLYTSVRTKKYGGIMDVFYREHRLFGWTFTCMFMSTKTLSHFVRPGQLNSLIKSTVFIAVTICRHSDTVINIKTRYASL